MASEELFYLSIDEASGLIKNGDLSPVELTRAYLDRIEEIDGSLDSYLTVLPESAAAEARSAEVDIQNGNYRGPMHGVPIALKDLYDTKGVLTSGGSKAYEDRVPSEDATTTARLKDAGAVLLGKVNMSELAMTGDPALGNPPKNPWNTEHVPGGSSSGSGVAVAAGLCAGALGSDTGGSIRFPASHNGIAGLLPSNGRVSRYGVMPLSWSLDNAGPMTRTVEDVAHMLQAIAGYDPKDPTSSKAPVPNYRAGLTEDIRGVKVGVMRRFFDESADDVDPESLSNVDRAIDALQELGAEVSDIEIPHMETADITCAVIYLTEGFAVYQDLLRTNPGAIGRIFRTYSYTGSLFTSADYIQAQRARTYFKREISKVFQRVDVIASPAAMSPAERVEDSDPMVLLKPRRGTASVLFNVVGSPAISVPCGFSSQGLPIGLQIGGKAFDEPTVLKVAYAYQQYNPVHKQHPPV